MYVHRRLRIAIINAHNNELFTVGQLLLVYKAGVVALLADDYGYLNGPYGIAQQLQRVLHGGQLLLQHLVTVEMRAIITTSP